MGGPIRRVALSGCLLALALVSPPAVLGEPVACPVADSADDVLDTVGMRGELTLRSGAKAVLAGIRWPDDAAVGARALAWLLEKRDAPLSISMRGPIDRWGRRSIDAIHEGDDLAGGLVAAGLAFVDAGENDTLCRTDLLTLEDAPRRNGEGVWATGVLQATDGNAYAMREGDFVVATGRIVYAAERGKRTYLNFTTRDTRGLSVTVSKRTWRIMLARGLTADTLRGRFVRVRGTIESWRGPMLDIASADMIEVLDGGAAPRR